jgi:hypothetical protein
MSYGRTKIEKQNAIYTCQRCGGVHEVPTGKVFTGGVIQIPCDGQLPTTGKTNTK